MERISSAPGRDVEGASASTVGEEMWGRMSLASGRDMEQDVIGINCRWTRRAAGCQLYVEETWGRVRGAGCPWHLEETWSKVSLASTVGGDLERVL